MATVEPLVRVRPDRDRPSGLVAGLVVIAAVALGATTVLLPVWVGAALLGLALLVGVATLTLQRFEALALLMLAGRAALDLTHVPGASVLRPSVVVTLGFAVVAVLWLVSRAKIGELRLSPVTWSALALAVAATVSIVFSERTGAAAEGALRFWILAIMFTTFEHLARRPGPVTGRLTEYDPQQIGRIVMGVLIGSVVPLIVGLLQIARGVGRIEGSLSHPNTFGFFLTVMLIVGVAAVPMTRGALRVAVVGLVAVTAIELVLTYSRSSYLAVVVAVIAMAVVARRYWVLPVIILAVVGMLFVPSVQERLSDLNADRSLRGTAGNSLVWRLDYWQELGDLASDVPATGIGSTVITDVSSNGKPAHNDIVKAYVETGVIGLLAYLTFVGVLITTVIRLIGQRHTRGWPRALTIGSSGVLAAFLVASLASNIIQQLVSLWYLMAFMATASSVAWARSHGERTPARVDATASAR
ncbi:O-antigen ligase family protein [Euzebya tangerina]|uniref:O-antigen ligase family protein n=1 Tax=Euzebya tangerina TaxID=591198 RepID=UPI000E315607|nr:O-antigen ligase family protein [Euzebya tangerina]